MCDNEKWEWAGVNKWKAPNNYGYNQVSLFECDCMYIWTAKKNLTNWMGDDFETAKTQ